MTLVSQPPRFLLVTPKIRQALGFRVGMAAAVAAEGTCPGYMSVHCCDI